MIGDILKDRIFVFGAARSGTTIILQILNSDENVYILSEADLYRPSNQDFQSGFNSRKLLQRAITRGSYLPVKGSEPQAILSELADRYSRYGEKVALGPFSVFSDFAVQHFADHYGAGTGIYSIRNPLDAYASQKRMFPDIRIDQFCEHWLETLAQQMVLSQIVSGRVLVLTEWIDVSFFKFLESKLQIQLTLVDAAISNSRASASAASTLSKEEREGLKPCEHVYELVKRGLSRESFDFAQDEKYYDWPQIFFDAAMESLDSLKPQRPSSVYFDAHERYSHALNRCAANSILSSQDGFLLAQLATEAFPEDARFAYLLGVSALGLRKLEISVEWLGRSIELGAAPFWSLYHRVQAYAALKQFDLAEKDLETLESQPDPQASLSGLRAALLSNRSASDESAST
ncbi:MULTISPECIES: sulfotransferase [Asticcacaulis]|uniref:sulfotransferase n=1 Tax=Asticcacaulis TaxID=76890 RepID=UPI001AE777AC|nr:MULTISPECIES: sulfotransferase [Asticcacaulis]MBP2161885.1 hypothetical protein [Asticcacaulis solisilvae]MDR6802932.1 hypothetical protein [Asticcacaulis sp. BE141]